MHQPGERFHMPVEEKGIFESYRNGGVHKSRGFPNKFIRIIKYWNPALVRELRLHNV